jgi:hypothetical protein
MELDQSHATTTENEAHVLVAEAYDLLEATLRQPVVTAADVVAVGERFRAATEHPEQDIWVTLTAEGPKNQCVHHQYPDGPYAYPPHEPPRACLENILGHDIEVTVG